ERERELKDRWRKACDDPQRLKKIAADTTTCSFSFVCLFSLLARTNQCRNRREFSLQTPRRRGIISFWLSLFAGFFISTVFYLWSEDETVCEC
ncbi:unnamed protein product, partial [Brassica napus]